MICEWCGKSFPRRKGRFCGTCFPPRTTRLEDAVRDARHVIGLLLTWADERDVPNTMEWADAQGLGEIVSAALDWENKNIATGAIRT